ncbi:SLC13 family permease [Gallaecimonas sp. GXIMD4217]|uniref:SLC13 family permease n=1 Tax=Gallaecimonas sp. GXIMD4217 TaxID=3131927 RepID=UPI00311ABDD6
MVIVAGILVLLVAGLLWGRLPAEQLFAAALAGVYLGTGLPLDTLLGGFINPALVSLALLLMATKVLERTPWLRQLAESLGKGAGRLGLVTALLSSVMNNTAVVAALLPMLERHPQARRLLLPLSYAALLGGTLTLVGTSTNLVVNSFLVAAGLPPLGLFDFFFLALPVVALCLLYLSVASRWLPHQGLPAGSPRLELNSPLSGYKAWLPLPLFALALGLVALGVLDLIQAMLIFLILAMVLNLTSPAQFLARFPWRLVVVIGSALGLAGAMEASGLAAWLAESLLAPLGEQGVWVSFLGLYATTWLLTELVTNNAAAALMLPLALTLARALGVEPVSFAMVVLFGASAAFLNPYGYQTHMLVQSVLPQGRRPFLMLGLPLGLIYGAGVLLSIPLYFPLR